MSTESQKRSERDDDEDAPTASNKKLRPDEAVDTANDVKSEGRAPRYRYFEKQGCNVFGTLTRDEVNAILFWDSDRPAKTLEQRKARRDLAIELEIPSKHFDCDDETHCGCVLCDGVVDPDYAGCQCGHTATMDVAPCEESEQVYDDCYCADCHARALKNGVCKECRWALGDDGKCVWYAMYYRG